MENYNQTINAFYISNKGRELVVALFLRKAQKQRNNQ